MALVGETGAKADFGERSVRCEHAFAGRADAQAMDVFADAFADAAAEYARKMDRMDTRFFGEFVEGEALAVLALDFVANA